MRLSGLREDTKYLKRLCHGGKNSQDAGKRFATAPLLVIPATDEFWIGGKVSIPAEEIMESLAELPEQFTMLAERDDHSFYGFFTQKAEVIGLKKGEDDVLLVCEVYVDSPQIDKGFSLSLSVIHRKIGDQQLYMGTELGLVVLGREEAHMDTVYETVPPHLVKEFVEDTDESVKHMLVMLHKFVQKAYHDDKYGVVAKRKKPDSKPLKRTHQRRDLPRLVYLNKMPSTENAGTGTKHGKHAPHRGHQRRGHRRRLMAERYKDHPKYQDEKGIYIRPMWVGPTEVEHEGNRYTLVTEKKDDDIQ